MKSKIIVAFLFTLLILISCSEPKLIQSTGILQVNSLSEVIKDPTVFKSLQASISDYVKALGIDEKGRNSRTLDLSSYSGYRLIKLEGDGSTIENVLFKAKESFQDDSGKFFIEGADIPSDDIPGTIDKLYVMGRYTLVSFLSVDIYQLLNAKQTTITESSYAKSYQGCMEFDKEGIKHRLDYSINEKEGILSIEYSFTDGENTQKYSEKLSFRTYEKCTEISDEGEYIKKYDTYGYNDSYFRKSFIIDNETGLIYSLRGLDLSVQHGVAYDKELGPVSFNVVDDQIEVTQLIKNRNLYIYDIICDKYGHYYILNDKIDEVSSENGISATYYTTNGEYIPLKKTGEVLHIRYGNTKDRTFLTDPIVDITIIGENLLERNVDYIGEIGSGGTITTEKNISKCIATYNESNGNHFSRIPFGSEIVFSKIDGDFLYGYGSDTSIGVEFGKIDLNTKDAYFITYVNSDENHFYAPDSSTLFVASRFADEKKKYSIYTVFPYERDEYKQHYYDYVLSSEGEITQTPTYTEFKDKYYKSFRKANCDKYTPDEFRKKYQIDLDGIGDIVKGWYNIDGATYEVEGIYSDTLKNATFYYVWKPGYSDKVFDDMYYNYIYVENGEAKTDLTNHVLLESIDVRNIDWTDIDFMNYDFTVNSSKGSNTYKIRFDENKGGYIAELASSVDAERKKIILQPIYK